MNDLDVTRFFGLRAPAFDKDVEDQDLWTPQERVTMVERIVESLRSRQHVLLCGEPGLGKSCILRAVRRSLSEARYPMTYLHNTTLGRRDFYRQICVGLGLTPKATAAALFHEVSTWVTGRSRDNIHPIFIIDEAQMLRDDVLGHLHVLANYEWDQKPLLSMVFAGLPDLRLRLERPIHRSLYSRIFCRIELGDSSMAETREYIEHRLKLAGAKTAILSEDAMTSIHELAGGSLRDIDRLAVAAMAYAASRRVKSIDAGLVKAVHELDRPRTS
jgi:type II secretory pathway predicted ATPase ExeA